MKSSDLELVAESRPCVLCRPDGRLESDAYMRVHTDGVWAVGILAGFEVPGWLVLHPTRHVEGLWNLNDDETMQLGRMLRVVAATLRARLAAAAVYAVGTGEKIVHWHILLLPRSENESARGLALLHQRDERRSTEDALRAAEELGQALAVVDDEP